MSDIQENLSYHVQSLDELRLAHERDPGSLAAAVTLAQAYANLERFDESIALYKDATARHGEHYSVMLDWGNVLYTARQLDAALELFAQCTALKPDRIEGWNNSGIVLLAQDKVSQARTAFEKVIALEPGHPGALVNLATCHQSRKEYDAAVTLLTRAVALKPDCIDGWFNLGNASIGQKNFPQAIEAFKKVLKYDASLASAHKNLGVALEQTGDLAGAEQAYRSAIKLAESDPIAHVNLANVCVQQGNLDEAKKEYLAAVKLGPREMQGWLGLRHLALLRGDIETYVRATLAVMHRLSPDAIADTIGIVRGLSNFDKVDDLIRQSDTLGLKGDRLDAERLLAYARLPDLRVRCQALEQSICKRADNDEKIREILGIYWAQLGNWKASIRWIDSVDEKSSGATMLLWKSLIENKEYARVESMLTEFRKQEPDSFDACFYKALLESRLDHLDEARDALIRALEGGFTDIALIEAEPNLATMYKTLT